MSEETDKTRLQAIIAQNKMILDRLNIIMEMMTSEPKQKDIEEFVMEVLEKPVPSDAIVEKGLPKTDQGIPINPEELTDPVGWIEEEAQDAISPKKRIVSTQIVGTLKKRPENQYSVTFLKDETKLAIEVIINGKQGWLPKSTIFGTYPNTLNEIKKVFISTWIIEKEFTAEGRE